MVLVLDLCGLRWGEMAGLHVEDVDFDKHRLSVRRSATTVGHEVVVDLPKSGRSRQVVFPAAPLAKGRMIPTIMRPFSYLHPRFASCPRRNARYLMMGRLGADTSI